VTINLTKPPGQRIAELLIKSKAEDGSIAYTSVQDDQFYNVAVGNYVANGGDGFSMIAQNKVQHLVGNLM